jgi:hypothetical protein
MDVYAKQGEATNLSLSSRESSPIKQERLPHATRYKKKVFVFYQRNGNIQRPKHQRRCFGPASPTLLFSEREN